MCLCSDPAISSIPLGGFQVGLEVPETVPLDINQGDDCNNC